MKSLWHFSHSVDTEHTFIYDITYHTLVHNPGPSGVLCVLYLPYSAPQFMACWSKYCVCFIYHTLAHSPGLLWSALPALSTIPWSTVQGPCGVICLPCSMHSIRVQGPLEYCVCSIYHNLVHRIGPLQSAVSALSTLTLSTE